MTPSIVMASPANNPFGAPPQAQNAFGTPQQQTAFSNPFGAPKPNLFGAPANNPFGAPAQASKPSPASGQHLTPRGTPPTGPKKTSRSPSPFGRGKPSEQAGTQGATQNDPNTMARRGKFAGLKPQQGANTSGGFGGKRGQTQGQAPQRATPFAGPKAAKQQPNGSATETNAKPPSGPRGKQARRQERYQPPPGRAGNQAALEAGPGERTKELSMFAYNYANKLSEHLKKDNIHPPKWPADIGNPDKRAAVDALKEAYKKYRTRVYASLRKADLIDDPEKRRKLEDALPFKGICEDMCPDYEKVCRIAEFDVKTEEKETRPDGLSMWPDPSRMVKKFGRSAAGQDAPLPMDVRSVDALRRTTDYLFNDLLRSESNLPAMHNFLWDRTRAVRKDFTFHSHKSAEEMKDMVYCFETITRFHATALHLLSRKGFAHDDFDQKQEIEQLGRTILSLMEAYDMCRDKRVVCENEAEFRAYYLLLNAHDPSIEKRIFMWGKEFWFESEEIQTALSLIRAMEDVREPKGPIKPRRPTTLSDTSFANYFAIVEDPRVSYTMACVAEIHFTTVRQSILRNLVGAYARRRDAPRTITASDLNRLLRFDTPEEAVEFAELHDFEFSTWVPEGKNPVTEPYLLLNSKKKFVPSPRVRQSFSGQLVERKRTNQSLPFVIYNTIYEQPTESGLSPGSQPDGMFVTQSPISKELASTGPAGTPFGNTSTAPSIFGSQASPSPFGGPAATPAPAPTAAFSGFPASQPPTATPPNPFASAFQPAPQAGTPTFSFTNPSPAPSPFGAAPATQTASSLFPAAKPAEPAKNPFAFLSNPEPPKTTTSTTPAAPQPAQPEQPAATQPPSAPSFIFGAASAPTPAPPPAAPAGSAVPAQAKPAEPAPPSGLGAATPLAGAPLFPGPQGQPTPQQATTTAAVPSILVTSPTTTTPPTQPAPAFLTAKPPSLGTPLGSGLPSASPAPSFPSASTPAPAPPPPAPPAPKRDLFGDFTKWYVAGDDGLLEHFTEETLRQMLWEVWVQFQAEEVERKRREEDEESWRLAREHMTRRLGVKYFYRWRERTRVSATKRILREEKERMRQYREQQQALRKQAREEQARAEQEALRKSKLQVMEDIDHISVLASSTRRRPSITYSVDGNPEEQLLSSGIFSGVGNDPRSLARRAVHGQGTADSWAGASDTRSLRYPESELELEPPRSARASPGASSIGSQGGKTLKLRQKFGLESRRSMSASGSVNGDSFRSSISKFRQSLAGSIKLTNFSAARNGTDGASDDGTDLSLRRSVSSNHGADTPGAKPKTRHWDLRLRGLVPMPDGGYLPEALVRRTRGNKSSSIASGPASLSSDNLVGLAADHDIYLPDAYPPPPPAAASARDPSPTPSDLRMRLERLKGLRGSNSYSSDRRSLDESMSEARLRRILSSTSPSSMPPPPLPASKLLTAVGKRKRASDVDSLLEFGLGQDADEQGSVRKVSPSVRKKALLEKGLDDDDARSSSIVASGGGGTKGKGVLALREETRHMVSDVSATLENVKRMVREAREFMDRTDREEGRRALSGEVNMRGGNEGEVVGQVFLDE
ncbi:hypothetical protein VTJ83DRAFT_5651 [Remersonia thermophila]|uniref:SAC3/GANP/THP3 conserved domain-containing protein n=1 Tax=Remersonia thermophila TaxID=72144 RepID=A0ABR4D8E4_9PEZI